MGRKSLLIIVSSYIYNHIFVYMAVYMCNIYICVIVVVSVTTACSLNSISSLFFHILILMKSKIFHLVSCLIISSLLYYQIFALLLSWYFLLFNLITSKKIICHWLSLETCFRNMVRKTKIFLRVFHIFVKYFHIP